MYRQELDFVRLTAALAVIAIHVTAGYMADSRLAFGLNQAVRFAVPVFVILSGLVNFLPEAGQVWRPSGEYLRRRLSRTLWPYFLWTLVYLLISGTRPGVEMFFPYLWALLTGSGYVHLYFFPVIIQLYLLYAIFLRSWVVKRPGQVLVLSLLLSLTTQSLLYLNQLRIIDLPGSPLPYIALFPAWLFYFVFGMWLAINYQAKSGKLPRYLLLLAVLSGLALAGLYGESRYFQSWQSSLKPDVLVYSLTAFLFWLAMGMVWRSRYKAGRALLKWLADQTLFIFLAHPLLIWLAFKICPDVWNGKSGMAGLYLVVTLGSILLAWMLSKWKYARYLGGSYYSKEKPQFS